MEGGNWKISEEQAGPSSSSAIAATKQHNLPQTYHHSKEVEEEEETEEEEDDDADHHHKNSTFVPGPLLSLKDQIERDKVFRFSPTHLLSSHGFASSLNFYLFLLNGVLPLLSIHVFC